MTPRPPADEQWPPRPERRRRRPTADEPRVTPPRRRPIRLPWQAWLGAVALLTIGWCWWQTYEVQFVLRLAFDWAAAIALLSMLQTRRRVLQSIPGWTAAAGLMCLWFLVERVADYIAYTHTGRPHMGLGTMNTRLSVVLLVCAALAVRDEWRYWLAMRPPKE